MHVLGAALGGLDAAFAAVAATPTPTPTVDPQLVTPGPWGFAVIAFVAVAVVLLVADMLRRIRRTRYREEARDELDAEQEAQRQAEAAVEASDVDDQSIDPGDDTQRR